MKILTAEQLERKRAYGREYSKRRWRLYGRTEEGKRRNAESGRKYHAKNRERCAKYRRNYYLAHREEARMRQREWVNKNREHVNSRAKSLRQKNLDHRRAGEKRRREQTKRDVIREYGGACACCGETRFHFLTIDHVGGRRKHGHPKTMAGVVLYAWLRRHGYPKDGFRLLCANCNCSYGFYGFCPHERERQQQAAD
jgi:hypothetical protein